MATPVSWTTVFSWCSNMRLSGLRRNGLIGCAPKDVFREVRVALSDRDARVTEELADLFEAPCAAPPARDERCRARVPQVVPADAARDARLLQPVTPPARWLLVARASSRCGPHVVVRAGAARVEQRVL